MFVPGLCPGEGGAPVNILRVLTVLNDIFPSEKCR